MPLDLVVSEPALEERLLRRPERGDVITHSGRLYRVTQLAGDFVYLEPGRENGAWCGWDRGMPISDLLSLLASGQATRLPDKVQLASRRPKHA